MRPDLDDVFDRLARSAVRGRFRLGKRERACLMDKGLETILEHGVGFIRQRLAPA